MKKKVNTKSRKQLRKESRIAKKARKHQFFSNKGKKPVIVKGDEEAGSLKKPVGKAKAKKKNTFTSLQDDNLKELKLREQQTKNLQDQIKKKRIKQLKEGAVSDDLEIARLEKLLRLKNKKEKSKSQFFASDGLDCKFSYCCHVT